MLNPDPNQRPEVSEVENHPFLKGAYNEDISPLLKLVKKDSNKQI